MLALDVNTIYWTIWDGVAPFWVPVVVGKTVIHEPQDWWFIS